MTMNKVMTMSFISTHRNNSNRSHTRNRSSKKKKKKSGNNDSSVKKITRITSSGTLSLTDLDLDCSDHSSRDDDKSNNSPDIIVHVQQEEGVLIKSKSAEEEREATTHQKKKKKKKVVRFSTVHIREYQVCLGDNPSVARGAPLSLDWQHGEELSHAVFGDDYEQQQQKHDRITTTDLKRSSLERIQLFKQLGYSRQEIQTATQRVQKIRQQRFHTRRQCQRREALRAFFFFALLRQKKKATAIVGS